MLIQFIIHTYSGTSRTAAYECADQAAIDARVDFYLSDTTGQTKSVSYAEYIKPTKGMPIVLRNKLIGHAANDSYAATNNG